MNNKCEVEVFSRVTGFFRPVQSWNKGKVEEFKQRKTYNVESADSKNENCRHTKVIAS
jgi:hypothetical protein